MPQGRARRSFAGRPGLSSFGGGTRSIVQASAPKQAEREPNGERSVTLRRYVAGVGHSQEETPIMGKGILLWFLGVPIPLILLILLIF